jgi:hypothetical protein
MAKLILRVNTLGAKAGDEIEVVDKDLADHLVRNGNAIRPATQKAAEKAVEKAASA